MLVYTKAGGMPLPLKLIFPAIQISSTNPEVRFRESPFIVSLFINPTLQIYKSLTPSLI